MRIKVFAVRCAKETLRDPLTLIFGVGFPLILIVLMSVLNNSIPADTVQFSIENLAPGMAVFGLTFLSLFMGMLIAGDRDSSFLARLFSSPMTAGEYILAYSLPMLPIAACQGVICFAAAIAFGLKVSVHLLFALVMNVVAAVFYIALGALLGVLFSYKQVGPMSTILINVSAWLSGTWFALELVGGVFERICYLLPFAHAVDMVRAAASGDYAGVFPHIFWVLGYALVVWAIAAWIFKKKMKA